jgi:hypothetical protein
MFTRLRHDALVSGNYKRNYIDTMYSGEHVLYETLMTRNINEADPHVTQIEICEAKVDSDAAFFFFRKTIGIFAGEGLDQRALTVIYVTGSADDD